MSGKGEVCACDESNAARELLDEIGTWLEQTHAQKGWEDDGARHLLAKIRVLQRQYRRESTTDNNARAKTVEHNDHRLRADVAISQGRDDEEDGDSDPVCM